MTRDAAVGAMILGAILLLGYMAARLGTVGGYRSGREVTMLFDDATGLVETAPVAAAGVKIGVVRSIEYADGGALVHARVRDDIALYADAVAQVRAKSLLGEKFVALDPGHAAAGALAGDRVKTTTAGDIDRMAAAFARAAEAMDPEDVKAIVHGLAVALSSTDQNGNTLPAAIRDVGADLHKLSASIENVSDQSGDLMKQVKPVLQHLDQQIASAGVTLDDLQPAVKKLPNTMDHLEHVSERLDSLLAKADKLDKEELKNELRKILEEEGIYVRLKPRKIKGPGGDDAGTTELPTPTPTTPLPGIER